MQHILRANENNLFPLTAYNFQFKYTTLKAALIHTSLANFLGYNVTHMSAHNAYDSTTIDNNGESGTKRVLMDT